MITILFDISQIKKCRVTMIKKRHVRLYRPYRQPSLSVPVSFSDKRKKFCERLASLYLEANGNEKNFKETLQ